MLATFADPKTDFVFKRIFGSEAHKDLLIALLNHLLELEGEHRILAVEHLALEQHVAVPELKLSIVDVKCTDATGRRFVADQLDFWVRARLQSDNDVAAARRFYDVEERARTRESASDRR